MGGGSHLRKSFISGFPLSVAIATIFSIACLSFYFDSVPVSHADLAPQRSNLSRLPQSCSSCAGEGNQTIYAPLVRLPESPDTEINLNCRSPHSMDVTPTFYTENGEAIVGDGFQMQAGEVKTVDLKTLMPRRIRNRQNLGGMTLSYFGFPLEMWGQLRLMHLEHGGSVDVTFANLKDQRSNERNAVWQIPRRSHATLAIGNVGSETLNAELRFSNGEVQMVQVAPFATALVRRRASAREASTAEAVTVTTTQGPNLVLTGLISADGNFTSSIRFHDTANAAQPNLYATRFRLQGVEPHIIVRNTSAQAITVTPRFLPAPSTSEAFIDLPALNLHPAEMANIDLDQLKRAVSGNTDFDAVSVQLLNTGTSGSLIGALTGVDQTTGMVYDVPLRDIGGLRTSTGSYPWRLDGDMSTIVSLTNVAPFGSEFVVQINYPGGHYLLNPQKLAAGGTATFDLRKIRDNQTPDRAGNTIPRSVTGGQFRWFIHGAGSGRLIGRAEMLSLSRTISSSYSCNDPCPPQMSNVWLDPSEISLMVEEEGGQTALEVDSDSYGNLMGPFSPWVAWWSNSDSSVVSMEDEGTYADFTGVTPGVASTAATIYYQTYGWDGLNCYYNGLGQTDATGAVNVFDQTLHFTHASYGSAGADLASVGLRDEGTLDLGQSGNTAAVCSGTAFTVTVHFTFPAGGSLFDHDDSRNQMITGANHQFEWQTFDFDNVNTSSGGADLKLNVFRRSQNGTFANYVDMIVGGRNPSGTTGSFSGKGRLHLTCP